MSLATSMVVKTLVTFNAAFQFQKPVERKCHFQRKRHKKQKLALLSREYSSHGRDWDPKQVVFATGRSAQKI